MSLYDFNSLFISTCVLDVAQVNVTLWVLICICKVVIPYFLLYPSLQKITNNRFYV
mgnify:CR=1 FL=1